MASGVRPNWAMGTAFGLYLMIMPEPSSTVLIEQRFLGSLLGAVDCGDLAQFLTEVHAHTPGPLTRWITDPAHRLVAEQVDDIITVGEFYAKAAGGQIIFT